VNDAKPKAVVLLSGGLDSATVLADALASGYEAYALTVLYGQRHSVEREAARRVAASLGVARQLEQVLDLRAFGGSALTAELDVPKDRAIEAMASGIPITYVPARNTVFLALALSWAESLGAFDLFVGVNCVDYSGYPDCRPEYLDAFERMAQLATKAGVEGTGRFRVHAPLLWMTKPEIVRKGIELGVDYGLTHSCYDPAPEGLSCGRCDSCRLRIDAFTANGLVDPIRYVDTPT
jgi:7-cyano-7-deazaguanine synthase